MKKIRKYFLTAIVMIMMFCLQGCSFLEAEVGEDSENNAKVTVLDEETLKIESPVNGTVKIEAIMLNDGVESHVKKEVIVKQNEEKEIKASEFESAKYKPTSNSKFEEIIEVKTVTEVTGIERVATIIFGVIMFIVMLAYIGALIFGAVLFRK